MATFALGKAHRKHTRRHGGGAVAGRGSARSTGGEVRAALWLARHPGWVLSPALAVWALIAWGALTVGVTAGR